MAVQRKKLGQFAKGGWIILVYDDVTLAITALEVVNQSGVSVRIRARDDAGTVKIDESSKSSTIFPFVFTPRKTADMPPKGLEHRQMNMSLSITVSR